ncbi:MAG: winged helix-turn-helix domain-containing protein [Saccharofermentanales bacterium]
MAILKFLLNPGYVSDLLSIFIMNFNIQIFPQMYFDITNADDNDTEFYDSIKKEFKITDSNDIPPELFVFFYCKNEGLTFAKKIMLRELQEDSIEDFNFDRVKDKYSNCQEMTINLFKYYFPDYNETIQFDDAKTIDIISDIINQSKYSDLLKFGLLSFFNNPQKNIQLLISELIQKEVLLHNYYERHSKLLIESQESFNLDEYIISMKKFNEKQIDFDKENNYVSFTLISRNKLELKYYNESLLIIVGYKYKNSLAYLDEYYSLPQIDSIARIISDKCRSDIVTLLNENEEMTGTEIAKSLKMTANSVFYHLDIMIQANVIAVRNKGKVAIYRINKHYFINASKAILKYS